MMRLVTRGWRTRSHRGEASGAVFGAGGQVTVEVAVGMVVIIAALISMAVYARRGVQGNLLQAGKQHGQQFNPNDPYTSKRKAELQEKVTRHQSRKSMVHADLLDTNLRDENGELLLKPNYAKGGQGDPNMMLKSLPHGPVLRQSTARETETGEAWRIQEDSTYERN